MGHPLHPATVHLPITFVCLTAVLDAVYLASITPSTSGIVASAFKTLDIILAPTAFPVLSYYSTLLALVTTIPAVATGAMELMPVIKRDGFSSKKAKTGVAHALINDVAAIATAYNWWSRRNQPGFVPDTSNVAISALLALPASFFAARLGAELVYHFGMGMGRGSAKEKKAQ